MKKNISFFIILLSLVSNLFADKLDTNAKATNESENSKYTNSFGYVSPAITAVLLAPIPLPNLGIGYRFRNETFGMDICVSAYPYIFANAITADGSLLFYSKKNIYGGFGSTGSLILLSDAGIFEGCHKLVLFNCLIGKEYLNKDCEKRFLQFEVLIPTNFFSPIFAFKYGISF